MENFLEYILMVLPAIRVDCFHANTRPESRISETHGEGDDSAVFELHNLKYGIDAKAIMENGEFVVQSGSRCRREWSRNSANHNYAKLFAELANTGILAEQDESRIFTENYAFKSPSAAAAVVTGRPANGTLEWKVRGSGKTYKEWEAEKLEQQASEPAFVR
jgi:hypothetical protein